MEKQNIFYENGDRRLKVGEFLKLDISLFPSEKGLKALIETINQISPTTKINLPKIKRA